MKRDDVPLFVNWLRRNSFSLVAVFILIVLSLILLWRHILISIDVGHAGVLYRLFSGGTQLKTHDDGLHIIAPWNKMFHYNVRKQLVSSSFDILSVRGLPVHVELAIRYHPDYEQLAFLHKNVGPEYERRVVLPQTMSVLRRELSRHTAEEIYTNAGGLMDDAIKQAREEVGRNYVVADDIVIRSITLPAPVAQAIEDKLSQRELLDSYQFRLQTATEEAERKRKEARGIRDYQAYVDATLSDRLLEHAGIRVTGELAASKNTRVIIVGGGKNGLPLVAGGQSGGQ